MKAIRADWVCPASAPPIRNGAILTDQSRIVGITNSVPEGIPVEEFSGCAIIPGFVNAHIHLELTVFRGYLEELSFVEWIQRLTRTKYDVLTLEDLHSSARLGALECLKAGVTTVGEVTDMGAGWEAMVEFGLRGVAYQEVFGPAEDTALAASQELESKVCRWRQQEETIRRIGVSPHAPYTVSTSLYRKVRDLAMRENLPVALHLAESAAEGDFVRTATGPFADHLRRRDIPVVARGLSPIGYLDGLGVLGDRTLIIHAVDCDAEDIRRLAQAGVAVAHCPKSNAKLGHGIAPITELIEAKIPVGLGTDSVASNNVIDMFEEMRAAAFLQRIRSGDPQTIAAKEAFRLATLGGARCLGLERHVGSLEAGKLADMAIVNLGDEALQPVYDPVEAMVYSANRANVVATFLGGTRVQAENSALAETVQRIADGLPKLPRPA